MFEKEFFKSMANLENQKRAFKSPPNDDNKFYRQLGFTEEEAQTIANMELYEINNNMTIEPSVAKIFDDTNTQYE